jgi:hypothetical protein
MSRTRLAVLAAVAVMAFATAPAKAMTVGAEAFGAFSTYGMSDWQDAIDQANAGGANFDDVNGGIGGGLGLRMWPNSNWMLAATWEPMFESSKDDASSTDLKLNGNSFQATAGYFFPTTGPAKFGVGAGLGFYSLNGEISDPSASVDVTGSTVGFHFLGMAEWSVSPGFAVTGSAGYRVAKISDTEVDGQSQSPELETDYSGMMLRAGVAFYMPSAGK